MFGIGVIIYIRKKMTNSACLTLGSALTSKCRSSSRAGFGHLSFVRYNFNIQSKLFITSLVITEYSTFDIKLLGTDNHLVKENIIQMN